MIQKTQAVEQTNLFISSVVDLQHHALPELVRHAIQTMYAAGKAINQPGKYGPAIETIIIDAIHQDYDSKFHQPSLLYDPEKKSLEAGVMVDLDRLLACTFPEAVDLYKALFFQVLDQMEEQVDDYDFDSLKRDLEGAIEEEIRVVE